MITGLVFLTIFFMCIGFGLLYLSFRRRAIMWSILSTIVFGTLVPYGGSIPFVTDGAGNVVVQPANYMIIGLCLMFALFSLLKSVALLYDFLKG